MKLAIFVSLFCIAGFANDEFFISYKAWVKNQILVGEEFNIAQVLSQSKNWHTIGNCEFVDTSDILNTDLDKISGESYQSHLIQDSIQDSTMQQKANLHTKSHKWDLDSTLDSPNTQNLNRNLVYMIMQKNKDNVLDCLHTLQAHLRDDTKFINNTIDSSIKFQYTPQRVKIKLENGFVKLQFIERIQ